MQEIAKHHGVKPENILLTAGSGEVLDVVGTAFLPAGKKVLGVEPTYSSVYQHATSIKTSAIKLPLDKNYRQDIPAMIKATNANAAQLGFVYLCNPNNPTGQDGHRQGSEAAARRHSQGMPVLIDEAYHHFVERPDYATSVPYVLEGRPVIIARTFSKIAALAGMRLGYAIASHGEHRQDAAVQHGQHQRAGEARRRGRAQGHGVAGQRQEDGRRPAQEDHVELNAYGYETIPSETNFFMVHIGREIQPVIQEFPRRRSWSAARSRR